MSSNRFRKRDSRVPAGGVSYDLYSKYSGCSLSASWAVYNSYGALPGWTTGEYRHMDDVVGNPPRPELGASGYTCNPVYSVAQNIFPGTGTDWLIRTKGASCTGVPAETYNTQWRRSSRGTTVGRQGCGFQHVVDPSGRLVLGGVGAVDSSLEKSLIDSVSTKVRDKRGRGSDTNLYESLAEFHKSYALLGSYLERVRKIWLAIKHKDPRALTKEVSAAYLMTRYGLMPLVMDIQSVIKAIEAKLGTVIETSRSQESHTTTSLRDFNSVDGGTFNLNGHIFSSTELIVRGWSLDQLIRTRSYAAGLSGKNLSTVAWELVPFSFVVDWFVNVGDFIGASIPAFGLTQLSSGISVRYTIIETYDVGQPSLVSPSTFDVIIPPAGSCTQVINISRRVPGLRAPVLGIKPNFRFDSFLRCADAYSLLVQTMTGNPGYAPWRI
jgi:hypothetical protein